MSSSRLILFFVKWPEAGRVKTRLARDVGDDEAVTIYRQLVSRVIEHLPVGEFEELRVCFDPAERAGEVEAWLAPDLAAAGLDGAAGVVFEAQPAGDLGDRLLAGFESAFRSAGEQARVVAIGSDCVGIETEDFAKAFDVLAETDEEVVYGPTFDGGFYLVGLSRPHPELFRGIPWSSEKTFSASLAVAASGGSPVTLLERRHDIDTESDWHRAYDGGEWK